MMKRLRPWLAISVTLNVAFIATVAAYGGWRAHQNRQEAKVMATRAGVGQGRAEHLAMLDSPSHAGQRHIVFLGDSLTEQAEWVELLHIPSVVNRGVSGDTTDQIAERAENIAKSRPWKIFLMAGINDLKTKDHHQAAVGYRRIMDVIWRHSPQTHIYVHSVLPVNNSIARTGRSNSDISALNLELQHLAAGDARAKWVNLHPAMAGPDGRLKPEYTHDGVHLNGIAYQQWGQAIAPLLHE